jgi:hypothetical protein
MEFLSEYAFEIKHRRGKETQVDNALNKRAHEVHVEVIIMYKTYLKYHFIATINLDQQYGKIKETLQQGNFQRKFNCYELKEDGILMYKGKVYVLNSSDMKSIVLKEMHNLSYV